LFRAKIARRRRLSSMVSWSLNTASFGGRQLAPTSIERQSLFSP
jgi:hypothetical protein